MNKKKKGGGTQRRFTPQCQVCLSTWVRNHVNKLQACKAVRDAVASGGWRSRKVCLTKVVETLPAVVVACNWVAFSATNEILSYCSLCQFRIQANFGGCCGGFSSFSLRPSIDVAPDGHVGELPRPCYAQWKRLVRSCGIFRYLWYLCKCWPNY